MEPKSKVLKIAAVILSIAAVLFVVLYLTGEVVDYVYGDNESSDSSSSVMESLTHNEQSDVSLSESSQPADSLPESSVSVPQSTPEESSAVISQSTPESTPTAYKFRNQSLLDQHYEKHGREMGFSTAEEYEKAASSVVNNPNALHKTEKEDGDDVYYVESTNEFVIVSTDGYIRTYFLPDRGIDYYNKQ